MPIVSIIVPIYNSEKYLRCCIDGILLQTFTDFELILIDDGSVDKSSQVCVEYASKDDRIKYIHKLNSGVSDTRNQGLGVAKGQYVIFLDADDYWYEDTALEQLVRKALQYDLDIVRGEYKAVDQEGCDLFERPLTEEKQQLANQILTPGRFYTKIMNGENFLVLSLFKRDAIGELRLNDKRSFLEDMEFYVELLLKPLRCMFIPVRFYAYRKYNDSASNQPRVKNLVDSFSMTAVFDRFANIVEDCDLKKAYRYNSIMMYYWTLETISQEPYYIDRFNIIRNLSLKELNKQVLEWVYSTKKIYPLPVYMSPILGIYYFRLKHNVGCLFRKIIKS